MRRAISFLAISSLILLGCYFAPISGPIFAQAPQQQMLLGLGAVTSSDTAFFTQTRVGTRHDIDGCLGYRLDMGGTPYTLTQLGRLVQSGNSLTHVVRVVQTDGTQLRSVTVNTSGQSALSVVYGSVSALTLAASTSYIFLSDETNGGDDWVTADTFTNTGIGTVGDYVFFVGDCSANPIVGLSTAGSTPGQAFVYPDFKYH